MKKLIKYFFIILATLFIVVVLLMILFAGNVEDDSNSKEELADSAMNQITSFYDKNGYYPKNLHDLPIYKNQEFVTYTKDHTFSYSSFSGDKPTYIFSWRAGAMGWTGYSCTNDKSTFNKNHNGVIRNYKRPDGSECIVTDLH
jgi:hypothetical protein